MYTRSRKGGGCDVVAEALVVVLVMIWSREICKLWGEGIGGVYVPGDGGTGG